MRERPNELTKEVIGESLYAGETNLRTGLIREIMRPKHPVPTAEDNPKVLSMLRCIISMMIEVHSGAIEHITKRTIIPSEISVIEVSDESSKDRMKEYRFRGKTKPHHWEIHHRFIDHRLKP